ncbi:hypothetical protein KR093_007805 [Drosophila rubida]|uniref:Uncharacterized protein n=1 Tax=Drosophila rubida TaxID=30044 RepID=A0AAD4JU55_9MUSC|nr:hypothetical protein KR093_007805 [Drosophila rubida]
MERLCRVCMDSSVTLVDIFAKRQQPSKKDPNLAEMLNEFCTVKPDDLLPQQICLSCVLATQNAYKFKCTCEESNRQLLKLLSMKKQEQHKSTQYAVPFVEAVYQSEELPVNLNCVKKEPLSHDEATDASAQILQPLIVKSKEKPERKRQVKTLKRRKQQPLDDKPHKCRFCGKGFSSSYPKRLHEKRHTGEKSHFCGTCGKGFLRAHDLTIHNRRLHTDERPFQCPHCPRSFIQNHLLRTHMQHHKTKELRCDICPTVFKVQSQLRLHQSVPHGPSEEKNNGGMSIYLQQKQQKFSPGQERGLRDKLPPVSYEELDMEYELNDGDSSLNVNEIKFGADEGLSKFIDIKPKDDVKRQAK